ncbi:MAG: hypothetical protein ACK4GN_06965 [Runella sp.]
MANFQYSRNPPKTLTEKILITIDFYNSPDWIFIHRDAENITDPIITRTIEIESAISAANIQNPPIHVKIIPIKMSEAWLLIDTEAIRRAAANPNGKVDIQLPSINRLETLSNPKDELFSLLKKASGLTGRRLEKFNVHHARYLVAQYIQDFNVLNNLTGYRHFIEQIEKLSNPPTSPH